MVDTLLDGAAATALGAGIAIGLGALGAGWSQGAIGSALMGAIAERPEVEGKALVYLVLPEIIAVLGFVVAAMLLLM